MYQYPVDDMNELTHGSAGMKNDLRSFDRPIFDITVRPLTELPDSWVFGMTPT